MGEIRKFDTGATRDTDKNKLDFEGFLSPVVVERFAKYMHKNRIQADGNLRDSDNWQKGIPRDAYMKSGFRHFFDWWVQHRGYTSPFDLEESLCGLLFNVQGYLHELLIYGPYHNRAQTEPHPLTLKPEFAPGWNDEVVREKLEEVFRGKGREAPPGWA